LDVLNLGKKAIDFRRPRKLMKQAENDIRPPGIGRPGANDISLLLYGYRRLLDLGLRSDWTNKKKWCG
jgi:hypothetical protein